MGNAQRAAVPRPRLPRYDTIIRFKPNNLAGYYYWAIKDQQWGILNSKKQVIVPVKYEIPYIESEFYEDVDNPVIMIWDDTTAHLTDLRKGSIISPKGSTYIRRKEWGYTFRLRNGHFGVMDDSGHILLPAISVIEPYKFSEESYLVKLEGNYRFCDPDWNIDSLVMKQDSLEEDILLHLLEQHEIKALNLDTAHFTRETFIAMMSFFLREIDMPDDEFDEKSYLVEADDISSLDSLAFASGPYLNYEDVTPGLRCLTQMMEGDYDADCLYPGEATTDWTIFEIRALSPDLFEIAQNDLVGNDFHIWQRHITYTYCRIQAGRMHEIHLGDLILNIDKAFVEWEPLVRDSLQKELGEGYEERGLDTMKILSVSSFMLDEQGLWLVIPIQDSTEDFCYPVPLDSLEKYIPGKSLLLGIRPFRKDK